MTQLEEWQVRNIEDTLRLVANQFNSSKRETCLDRMIMQSWNWVVIMENSLEKINREMGAKLRGEYGIRRGNETIRSMAEAKDGCKYPLWGRD